MKDSESYKRVLVVEEDDSLRTRCRRELNRRGYEAVETAAGREALELLRRDRFDMVVLEVDLPDFNGMSLYLDATRSNPEIKKENFLFTTSSEKLVYALSRTTLNYRKKPYHPRELADQVNLLLRGAAPGRAVGAATEEEFSEKRTERRLPWDETCRLMQVAGGASTQMAAAVTEDISGGGLRIRYSGGLPIAPGTDVVVEVRSLKIKSPARVVWSRKAAGEETTSGLRVFAEIPPSSITTVLTGR